MRIRHIVTRANVDPDGTVIDPYQIRHGIIVGARLAGMAGLIDPLTHLNRDFPDHRAERCLIVEAFTLGAPALVEPDGFTWAIVHPKDHQHRGRVDVGARRQAWLAEFRARGAVEKHADL